MVTATIIEEGKRRNYTPTQILSVLTLAIEEGWTDTTAVLDYLNRLDAYQAYKSRLYKHLPRAVALLEGKAGPLDALTPEEQHQLLEDVKQIRAQLGARAHPSWPSLGLNSEGEELTLRDAFGVMKADVAALAKKLLP